MSLSRFFKDRRAGVAPMLALGIVPLIGSVGAAVDYSRANSARTAMQAALDAGAIIASRGTQSISQSELTQNINAYFNANFAHPDVEQVAVSVVQGSDTSGSFLNLSAQGTLKTKFLAVMGFSTLAISVTSTVSASSDGLGCVLSLNPTASGAIAGQGSTSVTLNSCSLYDNSNNVTALSVGGSARIFALSVGVVGGMTGGDNITTTQGIKTGAGPVADPYADVSYPAYSGCAQQNFTAKIAVTIDPGVYCGGMKLNAGANVTLNPGIYYLDGDLTVNGGAGLTGSGVTLVFTGKNNSWATASINGNASIYLTAPKLGPTAGIVIFGDRNIPVGTTFKFNGGASQYLGGAVYVPTGAIDFSGGAATGTSCTQIIGNTVVFTGNSSIAINCSNYQTKPFSPLIIRLTS